MKYKILKKGDTIQGGNLFKEIWYLLSKQIKRAELHNLGK